MGTGDTLETLTAPPSYLKLRPHVFVMRSMLLGFLAASAGGFVNMFAMWVANTYAPGAVDEAARLMQVRDQSGLQMPWQAALAYVTVGAPLMESLLFPFIYWLCRWSPWRTPTFLVILGVEAWFGHGGSLLNFGQATCFVIMGMYYVELRGKYAPAPLNSPLKLPYFGVAIAHMTVNAIAMSLLLNLLANQP